MTLVLDSGGLTALAGDRATLRMLRNKGLWPPQVPSAVLVESLTGDPRRDHHVNALVRTCQVRDVDEILARRAGRLRFLTGRAGRISAVDALVVALAEACGPSVVLTGDPSDLEALALQVNGNVDITVV